MGFLSADLDNATRRHHTSYLGRNFGGFVTDTEAFNKAGGENKLLINGLLGFLFYIKSDSLPFMYNAAWKHYTSYLNREIAVP